MSLAFLSPDLARPRDSVLPALRSPVERRLRAAGARLELRDGWMVPADFGVAERELDACRSTVGLCDRSALGKLELQAPAAAVERIVAAASGPAPLEPGEADRAAGAWWCRVSAERLLAVCPPGRTPTLRADLEEAATGERAGVVEVTTGFGAIAVVGPRARDLFARLTALDLRPDRAPERALRPGSVARVPAIVLREHDERYLLLFGAALSHYMWTAVCDAAEPLGGALVGWDALHRLSEGEGATGDA